MEKSYETIKLFTMRGRVILAVSLVVSVLALGASWPVVPAMWKVHFEDGTTLEQAALAVEEIDGVEYFAYWWSQGDWSGGVDYKEDIISVRSEYWRKYYGLVLSSIRISEQMLTDPDLPSGPNTQALHDRSVAEKDRLDAEIAGCWEVGTCPSVLVDRLDIEADASLVEAISGIEVVSSVERAPDEPNFFFDWLRIISCA
ncbi:MAG: hypothetical protein AAF702_22890 [Chloroflexota bacterium]